MRSVKIISDGMRSGTRVVDSETGEEIHGVTKATWELDAGGSGIGRATIELIAVRVDVVGELADDDQPDEIRAGA